MSTVLDEVSFAALVGEQYGELQTRARWLVRDEHDAADVVQETCLRAWRARQGFRGENEPAAWLHRICTNVAYTLLRQKTRRRARSAADDDVAAVPDPDPVIDPAGRADNGETAEWAAHTIEGLPPALRSVMVRRLDEVPYPTIAGELGISPGTARVRGLRARRHLREAARREGLSVLL